MASISPVRIVPLVSPALESSGHQQRSKQARSAAASSSTSEQLQVQSTPNSNAVTASSATTSPLTPSTSSQNLNTSDLTRPPDLVIPHGAEGNLMRRIVQHVTEKESSSVRRIRVGSTSYQLINVTEENTVSFQTGTLACVVDINGSPHVVQTRHAFAKTLEEKKSRHWCWQRRTDAEKRSALTASGTLRLEILPEFSPSGLDMVFMKLLEIDSTYFDAVVDGLDTSAILGAGLEDDQSVSMASVTREMLQSTKLVGAPVWICANDKIRKGSLSSVANDLWIRVFWHPPTSEPFSSPGDSGALYVMYNPDRKTLVPIGIHVGRDPNQFFMSRGLTWQAWRDKFLPQDHCYQLYPTIQFKQKCTRSHPEEEHANNRRILAALQSDPHKFPQITDSRLITLHNNRDSLLKCFDTSGYIDPTSWVPDQLHKALALLPGRFKDGPNAADDATSVRARLQKAFQASTSAASRFALEDFLTSLAIDDLL